jgi:5-methylcytosine-specific restriction endonuclease McrBC regulatory subunit McrC
MSLMILLRLKALLDSMTRRFESIDEITTAPKGLIDWPAYAKNVSRGQFTGVPCSYPDLRDDRLLKGAIRYSLEKHLKSLYSQTEHGAFVHALITLYQETLRKVWDSPAHEPSPRNLASWLQRPLRSQHFAEGIQAIEWTVDERGLAGLSDLEGIPWMMPMDQFFEAWVETVLHAVARETGGRLRVARKRETTQPLKWDPPYTGSQRSLMPDMLLEWDSTTLIVDAKYKRHWVELQDRSWFESAEELKEQHRHDLLQVLAYSNVARTENVIACLAYPCSPENWSYLQANGRLIHKAELAAGHRSLRVWLTALPMATSIDKIAPPIAEAVKAVIRGI